MSLIRFPQPTTSVTGMVLAETSDPLTSATYADTGLTHTFVTTRTEELVTLNVQMVVRTTTLNAAGGSFVIAQKLDSDGEVVLSSTSLQSDEDAFRCNISMTKDFRISSPGSHTMVIRYLITGSTKWELIVAATAVQGMQIRQYPV
jgi:hypothetical protein